MRLFLFLFVLALWLLVSLLPVPLSPLSAWWWISRDFIIYPDRVKSVRSKNVCLSHLLDHESSINVLQRLLSILEDFHEPRKVIYGKILLIYFFSGNTETIKAKLIFLATDHSVLVPLCNKFMCRLKEYKSIFRFISEQPERHRGGEMCLQVLQALLTVMLVLLHILFQ